MKVLITGGAGFIGSHLVEYFQNKAEVRVLDNFRTGFKKNLIGMDVELIEGSVTDINVVKQAVKNIDYVFHLAAVVSVPESIEKPDECINTNAIGTLNVLREAAEANVKKLCLSSSSAIYGNNPILPKTENMSPEPMSPYAITKLDGEYYCRMFSDNNWLNTTCLRYFNVFGPRQDPKSQYAAAIPIFISRALKNESIFIYGDGEQTRDFIYVKDVVSANVFFAEKESLSGVYNVAYGNSVTIKKLADGIIKLTGSKSKIEYKPLRLGEVKYSEANINRLKSTGLNFGFSFDEGLQTTIKSFI